MKPRDYSSILARCRKNMLVFKSVTISRDCPLFPLTTLMLKITCESSL